MYCSQCGTKLTDNSLFCNVCGNQVVSSQSPKPASASTIEPPKIQQSDSERIAQELFTMLSGLAKYYNKLAKDGLITDSVVNEANDVYDKAWNANPDVSNPFSELLIWFLVAKKTYLFFNQRWLTPTISKMDKSYRNLISDDWLTYCNKSFSDLLTRNPDLSPEIAQSLCSHFPALSRWLEDKMLKDIMVARFSANMKPDKGELAGIVYLLGDERTADILRYASSVVPASK